MLGRKQGEPKIIIKRMPSLNIAFFFFVQSLSIYLFIYSIFLHLETKIDF